MAKWPKTDLKGQIFGIGHKKGYGWQLCSPKTLHHLSTLLSLCARPSLQANNTEPRCQKSKPYTQLGWIAVVPS